MNVILTYFCKGDTATEERKRDAGNKALHSLNLPYVGDVPWEMLRRGHHPDTIIDAGVYCAVQTGIN